eukprot:scaffold426166_cov59-Attheya_sp.AAC.1
MRLSVYLIHHTLRTLVGLSLRSAWTVTHSPRMPFMAFSPGIGLEGGQGFAEYLAFRRSSRMGPTALAGA